MKRLFAALTVFGVAFGMLAISNTALAKNSIMDDFTATYGTSLASCSTCHTGSIPALNPYGSDLLANGLSFTAVEGLDSDRDGVSNLQEIRNGTNPGVAPAAPPTTTAPSTTTTTIASTTSAPATATTTTSIPGTTTITTTTPPGPAIASPLPGITGAPSEAMPFIVGGVGTVWLAIEDGSLVVVQVDTNWKYRQETDHDGEIEIEFRDGNTEVEFEAELEDGTIRTKVEFDDDRDDDDDDDDDDRDDDDRDDDDDDHHRHRGGDDDDD